jgi:hypothetical protein
VGGVWIAGRLSNDFLASKQLCHFRRHGDFATGAVLVIAFRVKSEASSEASVENELRYWRWFGYVLASLTLILLTCWHMTYTRFHHWVRSGVWAKVLAAVRHTSGARKKKGRKPWAAAAAA